MPRSKLTSKGQTTIPFEVRERLGLDEGDVIDFVFQDNGWVALRLAKRDVLSLEGILHRPGGRIVPVEAMDAVIRQAAVNRDRRVRKGRGPAPLSKVKPKRRP